MDSIVERLARFPRVKATTRDVLMNDAIAAIQTLQADNAALREGLVKARQFVAAWPLGMPVSHQREVLANIDRALLERNKP